jgi:S-DNA-T family DNA segregation ATPase FtsK/SpoIIIE
MPARPLLEDDQSSPAIAITIPIRFIGFVMLGLVALVMLALATWSVDDPSLSYATANAPRNWLGFPGAVVADLAFQIFGLGIILILLPPALWAWSLIRRIVPTRLGLRLIAWIAASLLATGVLGFVPIPKSWPLPTGLGGLIGAGFWNLATLVTGADPQPITAALFGIIIATPTLALYWLALGTGAPRRASGKRGKADLSESTGILDVVIGGMVHLAYSAQSAFRRSLVAARANAEARRAQEAEWRDDAVEPSIDGKREPRLVISRPSYAEPEEDEIEPELADAEEYEDEEYEEPSSRARVSAAAKRPAPGRRAAREAQGSLLEDESGFELPELSLLAEAKHKGLSDEHRPERLEAMARRLEGVLEDFGVKGDIINVRPGPVVTLYELEPAPGIKSSRVISLADDIARSMSAISARVAVVPGRNAIVIEMAN